MVAAMAAARPSSTEGVLVKPLTARELEILNRLAQGQSTRMIAERLFISPITVRNHVAKILGKLRVHNRLAAVAAGYERGLIDPIPSREARSAH